MISGRPAQISMPSAAVGIAGKVLMTSLTDRLGEALLALIGVDDAVHRVGAAGNHRWQFDRPQGQRRLPAGALKGETLVPGAPALIQRVKTAIASGGSGSPSAGIRSSRSVVVIPRINSLAAASPGTNPAISESPPASVSSLVFIE